MPKFLVELDIEPYNPNLKRIYVAQATDKLTELFSEYESISEPLTMKCDTRGRIVKEEMK